MQIQTVKQTKSGYLLNESSFVPNNQDNSDYQAIQEWIAKGGVVEAYDPFPEIKEEKIAACKSYLAKTDWECTAYQERGRAYDETKAKRLKAVSLQDDIEACTTIEELNNIKIEF